jgi:PAS domain S-box-containing protein
MHGYPQADTFRTDMSFKQLLKKGTLGDLRERVSPDRDPSTSGSTPAGDQSPAAPARSTRVLYVTGDARESRIVSGAFSHSHPHLDFDFSVELSAVRAHLSSARQHDVLIVGWSVPGEEAFSLIGYAREHGSGMPIVAAAEQSLELYRQAGADECVRKGGSFLSRLPIAIEEAIKKRPAPASASAVAPAAPAAPAARAFSPGVVALRVGYAGDLEQLRTAVAGLEPPLECVSLADALKDSDLQPGTTPVDIVLIEHGDKAGVAIADVRARNLEVALVLLVEPADERTAFETFGASLDDYVAKTSDWPVRLQLRLTAARTRYQQTRELASLRVKEARLRSLVEKLPACIVRMSADGVVLATNDRAVTLLGASSAAQVLRKQFDLLVPADAREAWTDFVVRVCAGETRSTEVAITTFDGIDRTVEAAAVPSPSEFGRSPSLLMVLRDVTERKRLEAVVEQVTELAAEPPPDFETDTDLEFLPEPPVSQVVVSMPAPIATQERRPLRDLEADLHRISGTARATFEELGSLLRDAESQHDVALNRQAEEYAKLKAIEIEHWQFYEAFVQAASHGIFRATPEGRLLNLNPAMAAVLGYDSPAAVLAASASLAVMMEAARWDEAVARWRDQASEAIETRWRGRDRQLLTLRLYGRLIDIPNGDGQCLEVVAENLTAQRALETQLRRARRWEDVARVTSGIAADLTHVVNEVGQSQDVEAMHRAASKAVALSRQLVAFGRREARDLTTLDLNSVVSHMEDVLRRLIDEHLELILLPASSLAPVRAAQPPLEEALVSLTVAAADVLPAGGRIYIETATMNVDLDNHAEHVGVELGAYGVISLTAIGWGIDGARRDRMLAAQARAEDVSRGYSSAVRAVGQAGGGLRLDSVSGDSLTFRVYVPHVTRDIEARL